MLTYEFSLFAFPEMDFGSGEGQQDLYFYTKTLISHTPLSKSNELVVETRPVSLLLVKGCSSSVGPAYFAPD